MGPEVLAESKALEGAEVQSGRYLFCPNGSHCAQYDDQQICMSGLIDFIKDVDAGNFSVAHD
jgi:hypothetical protein